MMKTQHQTRHPKSEFKPDSSTVASTAELAVSTNRREHVREEHCAKARGELYPEG